MSATTRRVVAPRSDDATRGNGYGKHILGDATRDGDTWEFVVDAGSSPSTLTVHAVVDGHPTVVTVKAHPHCTGEAS